MNLKSVFCSVLISVGALSCQENKIDIAEGRMELPEPDKDLRIGGQVRESLVLLASEITNSDEIESNTNGEKIVNSGIDVIPYLMNHFSDSTETKVYSQNNKRCLTLGEIAIVLASEIKPIPIFRVVGVQQCVPPFDMDIENYLGRIKNDFRSFNENYAKWFREEK